MVCLPWLACPSSSGRYLLPGRRCPPWGQLLEFMLHTGPFVTLSNLQHFFGYNKCLDGRVKPLPSLLINVHRVLSCNKLANPAHKIVIYTDGFAFASFPLVCFFFSFVPYLFWRCSSCELLVYIYSLMQQNP